MLQAGWQLIELYWAWTICVIFDHVNHACTLIAYAERFFYRYDGMPRMRCPVVKAMCVTYRKSCEYPWKHPIHRNRTIWQSHILCVPDLGGTVTAGVVCVTFMPFDTTAIHRYSAVHAKSCHRIAVYIHCMFSTRIRWLRCVLDMLSVTVGLFHAPGAVAPKPQIHMALSTTHVSQLIKDNNSGFSVNCGAARTVLRRKAWPAHRRCVTQLPLCSVSSTHADRQGLPQ